MITLSLTPEEAETLAFFAPFALNSAPFGMDEKQARTDEKVYRAAVEKLQQALSTQYAISA